MARTARTTRTLPAQRLVAAALLAVVLGAADAAPPDAKPNIVLMIADDLVSLLQISPGPLLA